MADEYELLPAEELESLREEVGILKANSFGNTEEAKSLLEGIQQLNDNINRLIKVFSDVDQELVAEYNKVKSVDEQYHDLQEQNKKIASGILTVANLIEDVKANGVNDEPGDVPDFKEVPTPPTPEQDASSQNSSNQGINFNPATPGATPPPLTTGPVDGFGDASNQAPAFQDPFEKHASGQAPVDPWAPQPGNRAPPQTPPQNPTAVPPRPGEQSAMPNAVPPNLNANPQTAPPSPSGQPSDNRPSLPNQASMPPPPSNAQSFAEKPFTPPPDPFAGSGLSTPPPEPPKKKGLFGLFS